MAATSDILTRGGGDANKIRLIYIYLLFILPFAQESA